MSRSGVNMAVTENGEAYNKLRRPDGFVAAMVRNPPPKDGVVPAVTQTMDSNKRKLDETDLPEESEQSDIKRSKSEDSPKLAAIPQNFFDRNDDRARVRRPVAECGMQTMFPGLDDEDSSDEITREAMAYLRNVRTQASGIPSLLVAPPPELDEDDSDRSMYHNGRGDGRAVYKDGTWIAVDPDGVEHSYEYWSDEYPDIEPQEGYYKSLVSRFKALRGSLKHLNPRELARRMDADPGNNTTSKLPTGRHEWIYILDREYPRPAQVAQIDEKSLYRGLEFCAHTLDRFENISKEKSCWIWTLLALVGEPGTLDYLKVGRIRDLGHKAGQLSVRLRSGTIRHPPEDEDEDIEEWSVDGQSIDNEDGESNGKEEIEIVKRNEIQGVALEVVADDISADVKAENEKQTATRKEDCSPEVKVASNESSDEMSMSEDDVTPSKGGVTDPVTLEEARARLLAQLGDRLVQPGLPEAVQSPRSGGRHRHHGKVCQEDICHERYRQGRQYSSSHPRSNSSEERPVLSRADAEKERQQIRKQELNKTKQAEVDDGSELPANQVYPTSEILEPSSSTETLPEAQANKVFRSRLEAEEYREQYRKCESMEQPTPPKRNETSSIDRRADSIDGSEKCAIDLNTRVTIDMIITIVAEYYGQRDLLRFRETWT